jgi:hypothetical protein
MNDWLKGIEAATADASPEIREAFKRLASASADAEKDFAAGAAQQAANISAVEKRIEEITMQLEGKSRLTNNKRRALNKERDRWQRWLRQTRLNEDHPEPKSDPASARRMKATEKKLRWLARKTDRENG